jgi:hypothetical protein
MPDSAPSSDRFFDFSLRLLTMFVVGALVACTAFLVYRWLAPQFSRPDTGQLLMRHSPAVIQPAPALAGPSLGDEVLMDPHRVFRCVEGGRVSFSDKACEDSVPASPAARAMPAR